MKSLATILTIAAVMSYATASLAPACYAQGMYNESNIYIGAVDVYVDGEIINDGRLDNDGLVSVTGDWQSKGKYKGSGTVALLGNSPQKIFNYGQAIQTLIVDGWGTKYIKGDMRIGKQLQLKDGIVEVSRQDALKLEEDAYATGGSASSYVDGALTVEGSGYKFFPIGKNGNYAPIEFVEVQAESAEYSVEVFEDAPLVAVEDIIVRKSLYWQRKDISGNFGGSAVAIDYDRGYFENPDKITLLAGTSWEAPFAPIHDLDHSAETNKVTTRILISAPIIMLGEISERWREADFYLSTALSPHATQTANQNVKIFGERLSSDQFRFQVFNRWGDLVYETTSLEYMTANGWSGHSLSGNALTTGTYPYRLSAFDKSGQKFEKKGVITIIN